MKNASSRASLAFLALTLSTQCLAAEDTFSYPELSVVPRASDRLEMEAQKDGSNRWTDLLQVEVPAAAVLVASFIQAAPGNIDPTKDSMSVSPWIGTIVGGGWLAYGIISQLGESPYASAANEMKALPKGTIREQLTRERMAEEALQRKARQMRLVRWASAVTLVGASVNMAMNANSGQVSKMVDIGAGVVSLLPLILPTRYEEIATQQMDYKKRIFAPVASSALFATSQGAAPGMSLTWKF